MAIHIQTGLRPALLQELAEPNLAQTCLRFVNFMRWPVIAFVWLGTSLFSLAAEAQSSSAHPAHTRKVVTQYAITSANDRSDRDPKDWRLLGSNDDGQTWVTLDTRKDESFTERLQRRVFSIANSVAYNMYRFAMGSVNQPTLADSIQLAEFELISLSDENQRIADMAEELISAQGDNNPAEAAAYAFDRKLNSKWLDFSDENPQTRSSWLQIKYVPLSSQITTISQLIRLSKLQAERSRPVRIYGIITKVDLKRGILELMDTTARLTLPIDVQMTHYPIGQQVLLEGKSGVRLPAREGSNGSISSGPVVLQAQLKVQESYQPKPQRVENAVPGAPPMHPFAKVVTDYAITSANDTSGRDPLDWRLLGSNDDGQNWTTLDIRKGEIFSLRFQRRAFSITNSAAFNIYRLQIDSVRRPLSSSSIQLAEFELISPVTEDERSAGMAEELISAQDDNPPGEAAANAFDHHVETKWLDFAIANPTTRSSWLQVQYVPVNLQITNITQLKRLSKLHAAKGWPVRIEGILANVDLEKGTFYFVDRTGSLALPIDVQLTNHHAGQKVLLEGRSGFIVQEESKGFVRSEVTVLDPQVKLLKDRPPKPELIEVEQTLAIGALHPWAETEGMTQFVSQNKWGGILELVAERGRMTLIVPGANAAQLNRYFNLRVRE